MALYYNPINRFVAGFIGSPKMNFLPVTVVSWTADLLTVSLGGSQTLALALKTRQVEPGENITLGIRPEHLSTLSNSPLRLDFQCEVVERLGNSTYLFGQCHGHDGFKMLLPGDAHFQPYQKLQPGFEATQCMAFDADGLRISAEIAVPHP